MVSKIKIRPTRGNVLIEAAQAQETTEAGVYLPETAQQVPQKGVIVAMGPPSWQQLATTVIHDPHYNDGGGGGGSSNQLLIEFVVGDLVYYQHWAGIEVKEKDKKYKLVKYEDVLAVIEK